MADYSPTPSRGPGRPRNEETKAKRRRRSSVDALQNTKLGVDESLLDNRFEHRWLNDTGTRLHDKTKLDDWDLVKDPNKTIKEDVDGLGSMVSKVVGSDEHGNPIHAYLARKPREYFEEDRAEKRKLNKEQMQSIKRGVPQGDGAGLGNKAYVPDGGAAISIEDGRSR